MKSKEANFIIIFKKIREISEGETTNCLATK